MKAVIQRVKKAVVEIEGKVYSSTGEGLLVLLGVGDDDLSDDVAYCAEKTAFLRIFEDDRGKMNLSCLDINGEILVVSQFTLLADIKKGRRPNFMKAAKPEKAVPLYEDYVNILKSLGLRVATGSFGAMMDVKLTNMGPVTIIIDSKEK